MSSALTQPTLALRVLLLAVIAVAAWLVRPFADAVLVAAVVAILAWPLHKRLLVLCRGRRLPATALAVLGVTLGVVVPVLGMILLVTRELSALANQLVQELDREDLVTWLQAQQALPMVTWVVDQLGGAAVLAEEVQTGVRGALGSVAAELGQYVPSLLGVTARLLLKAIIFYLTLTTLFHRGNELVAWSIRMSPLRPAYTARLIQVFALFARNVVLAGIAAASVQGLVAGIGYLIAGVERPLFFAVLTGIMGFVPVVGTPVAWVPVTLLLLLQGRTGAALFVVTWSVLLTGTVDNIVKPLVVRGKSDMPTVMVFLGVFGGLMAFGIIGLLVGPVLMAMLLALLRIYEESLPPEPTESVG